jgi:hypothetical protein
MSSCNPKGKDDEKRYRITPVKAKPSAEKMAQGLLYDMELKDILRKGDVFSFRNFLDRHKRPLPDEMMLDTIKMETVMHQIILTIPELEDLHEKSKKWLDDHTVLKTRGLTLLQASRMSPSEKKEQIEAETAQAEVESRRSINLRPSFKPENN